MYVSVVRHLRSTVSSGSVGCETGFGSKVLPGAGPVVVLAEARYSLEPVMLAGADDRAALH
jgi:hypothetical protein